MRKPLVRPHWVAATYGEAVRIRPLIPGYAGAFHRKVAGGRLDVILAFHPSVGWHLSIAFEGAKPRLPTWDEISDARYSLLPDRLHMAIHLPPRDEYVNVHPTTMHLFEAAPPREVKRNDD